MRPVAADQSALRSLATTTPEPVTWAAASIVASMTAVSEPAPIRLSLNPRNASRSRTMSRAKPVPIASRHTASPATTSAGSRPVGDAVLLADTVRSVPVAMS